MLRNVELVIDLKKKKYDPILLKQMDTTVIKVRILDDNIYPNFDNQEIDIIFTKPNESIVQQVATNINENGIVTIPLKPDCVRDHGKAKMEIEIKKTNSEVISSFQIPVFIEKTSKENVTSQNTPNYFEEFAKAIDELKENSTQMLTDIDAAEKQRIENETARGKAEENRDAAEKTRVENEITRGKAEENRDAAEKTRVENENTRKKTEESRDTAEETRVKNETAREEAEGNRNTAEEQRIKGYETIIQDWTEYQKTVNNTLDDFAEFVLATRIQNVEKAGTDLNDYITEGKYFFATEFSPINAPEGGIGWLIIYNGKNTNFLQIWFSLNSMYIRVKSGENWSDWQEGSGSSGGGAKTFSYLKKITADGQAGETITIPCKYKVGAGVLDVYWNGLKLIKGTDDNTGNYLEIGDINTISTTIKLSSDWNLRIGDTLEFVVRGEYK